jgi:tetratricopeptide (TPR) repeat protein
MWCLNLQWEFDMSRKLFAAILVVLSFYILSTPLWADPADDYYREANTFFTNKDYQRAFDAYQGAIPFDTNPYRAYLGMGNSEYFLNDKIKAVEYLQKSYDLFKDEKVAAFIAKIKATIPPPKTPLFVKAENLLKDKLYKQAIPLLKEVEQYESTNLKAFYDMGYCYYELGNKPEATLNFAYYEAKTNDPAVVALLTKMKSELTVDDREWVDAQVELGPPFSPPFHFSGIGIRFEPSFQFASLKDFNAFVAEMTKTAGVAAQSDSSFTFQAGAPPGGLAIELNPYVQVSEDLEVGLSFGTLFLGQLTASYTAQSEIEQGDAAMSYSVIEAGISIRSEMMRLYKNKIKFFIEADPTLYMTSVATANSEVTNTTPNPGFDFPLVTGSFNGSGAGARFKLGVDWKPLPNSIVSGFLGFQMAQIQGFVGSGSAAGGYSGAPVGTPTSMPGQLETVQGPNGTRIIFVPTGVFVPGASPLTLDLSGIIVGADFTILL